MRIIFVLNLFIFCVNSACAQCPELVWSDEFDRTEVDTNLWKLGSGLGTSANELTKYVPGANTIKDGKLQMAATKVDGFYYFSGRMSSKADFKYGKFEARIKLPSGKGIWPAFWLLPSENVYGAWPRSGEIDIVETRGSETDVVNGYLNYGSSRETVKSANGTYAKPSGKFSDDFHIYRIEWSPNLIKWYVDDIFYSAKRPEDLAPDYWAMNEKFRIMLTNAIGGNYAGVPDETTVFPAIMEVDYVRVYKGDFLSVLSGDKRITEYATNKKYKVTDFPAGSTFNWTVPDGATIVSGQNTDEITVNWGDKGGLVNVEVIYACGVDVYNLSVSTFRPDFIYEDFESNRNVSYLSSAGILSLASNPAPGGNNSSSVCGSYLRNASVPYDAIYYSADIITDPSQFRSGNKKFHLDVYTAAPIGSTVSIELLNSERFKEGYPKGFHSIYRAKTTKQNEWETLEFDYDFSPDNIPNNAVDKMQILFNSGTNTSDRFYIDNFLNIALVSIPDNLKPDVKIITPTYNAAYVVTGAEAEVNLTSIATDLDGTISKVEYYNGNSLIGTATTPPYLYKWFVPLGDYSLTAKAYDDKDSAKVSDAVNFNVSQLGWDVIEDFEANRNITYTMALGTLEDHVTNPERLTINTSEICGKYTRSESPYDRIAYQITSISNANEYKLKRRQFRVDIYTDAPVGSRVVVQLENKAQALLGYPKGIHSFYSTTTTKQNAWETLVFEFEYAPDANFIPSQVDQLVLLFNTNQSTTSIVYFDNLVSVVYPNKAPKIQITSPLNQTMYREGSNVSVEVNASDSDGDIAQVEFFDRNTLIATVTSKPYKLVLNNAAHHHYVLKAIATDNAGAKATSNTIEFIVNKVSNILEDFQTNRNIIYEGANGVPLNPALTQSVFNSYTTGINSSNLCGKYVRTSTILNDLIYYDVENKVNSSDLVTSKTKITMDVYSTSSEQAYVYLGLGNSSGLKYVFAGQITEKNKWNTITFLYNGTNASVPNTINTLFILFNPGKYSGETYLFDNITIVENQNLTPIVTLVAPDDDEKYDLGESVNIRALGFDYDGSIAQVDFYEGDNMIGSANKYPYEFTWTNPPQGKYRIVAKVMDNKAAQSTSNTVTITVGNIITSVDDIANNAQSLTVYPNPFNQQIDLFIKGEASGKVNLIIVNSLGQPVYDKSYVLSGNDDKIHIEMDQIPPGYYYLLFNTVKGQRSVKITKN